MILFYYHITDESASSKDNTAYYLSQMHHRDLIYCTVITVAKAHNINYITAGSQHSSVNT
jgi:hypothetical protein